jgi:hypothetical protein
VADAHPLPPANLHGPIFIVSAMGSGSTLLRLMLDSHEHIAIPHETGFMRAYKAMQFIPFKWTGYGWAYRLGWSEEEFDEELRRFFNRIFMRYAEQHDKRRWGDKTPLHTWHITALARVFPDSVFIGIVRHPGASTASNMRRFHHPVMKMAIHYNRYNKEIARQAAHYSHRFVVLRFEDLVLRPEQAMRELLDWLGEPWSPRVLEHHAVQSSRNHSRVEGMTRAEEPIDPSRTEKWVTELDPDSRRAVVKHLGRLGEFYGYSMDDPAALAPLNRGGSFLFGDDAARDRVRQFPDLELETRMPVPIFEHYYNPRRFWLIENETGEPPRHETPPPSPLARKLAQVEQRLPYPVRRRIRRARRRLRRLRRRGSRTRPEAPPSWPETT